MRNWTGGLLAVALAWMCVPAWAEDAPGPFAVWQLPEGTKLPPGQALDRKGWKLLDADAGKKAALPGGVAVENPTLLAVIPAGGDGVVLLAKARGAAQAARQDMALVDAKGKAAGGLGDVKMSDQAESEAVVSFSAGGVEAKLKLTLGKPLVEVIPGQGAGSLQVKGEFRFSFVPDFFGDDVLYDARETPAGRVYPPAENFMVNLIDGHSALTMLVWPKDGGQEVSLQSSGGGEKRRFDQTQVSFNGKSVFVAILAREGIWYGQDLKDVAKDKAVLQEGWQRPFPAKWMTIMANRPRLGAESGMACLTMPILTLPAAGDAPYSDVYYHPMAPSWFTGTEWRLFLQTQRKHMMTQEEVKTPEFLVAINYPRDRVKDTPLDAYTLVDVMLGALGRGPCEYVLDLEGLNKTRSTGAAGTGKPTVGATCATHGALVYYYLGEREESFRRDEPLTVPDTALESVEGIKDFLDAAYGRIQEYLTWSDQLVKAAEEAKAKDPAAGELADRVISVAREMRQLWGKMVEHDKPCANPMEWRMALDHCKNLIRTGAPDLPERIAEFDPQMRGAGEEVDGGMQACRLIVKRIRQEAAMAGSADPKAMAFAAVVRARCQEVLKNKHYKEGDSVKIDDRRAGP
jgi:hypothetical protein